MNIKNFAINDVAIYQPGVTTGDTIEFRFVHVTGGHVIDFEPVILSYASTFFTARIECVINISQQDLAQGKIWLIDGDGYYNYEIKKNGSVVESGQLFIQAQDEITIENNPNNSVIITQFGAGSSGSSGNSGTAGVSGTNGVSGSSGLTGSSGSSGANGTSGVNGATGAAGSSGSSGANGATGSSGSSGLSGTGAAGSSGSSGANGVSGSSGSSGLTGVAGSSGSSGQSGSSGSSGSSGVNGISAGRTYYFNQSQNSDVSGYKVLAEEPTTGSQQDVTVSLAGASTSLMSQFITPELGFNVIPSGVQRFFLYFTKPASNDNLKTYITLQLTDASGTPVGGLITSQTEDIGWNSGNPSETIIEVVFATTNIDPTYRIMVKVYGQNADSTAHNLTFSTENGNYSFVVTSVGVSYATSGSSGSSGSNGIKGLQNWTALYSANIAETNNGTFIKTSGGDAFNAGIRSQEGFPTAYVSGKPAVPISTSRCYIGLDRTPGASNGWDDVDYLIGWSIGAIFIHEGGVTAMEVTQDLGIYPTDTTQYTVTYDGVNVRYYVDNTLVRTVARDPALGNLYMDGTIYNQGYGFTNVVFGPYGQTGVSGSSGSSGTSAGGGSAMTIRGNFGLDKFLNAAGNTTFNNTLVPLSPTTASSTPTFNSGQAYYYLTTLKEGLLINYFGLISRTANASIVYNVCIYEAIEITNPITNKEVIVPGNVLYTFATNLFDNSTTGHKTLTNLNYTLAASTVKDVYFIGFGVSGGVATTVSSGIAEYIVFNPGSNSAINVAAGYRDDAFTGTFQNSPVLTTGGSNVTITTAVPYLLIK